MARPTVDHDLSPGPRGPASRLKPPSGVRHSGRLTAGNRCGMRMLSAVVRKTHDHDLLRFFILVSVEWLPVERRLTVSKMDAGRGDLCKICDSGQPESVRHLWMCTCPALAAARDGAVQDGVRVLQDAGVRVRCGSSVHVLGLQFGLISRAVGILSTCPGNLVAQDSGKTEIAL